MKLLFVLLLIALANGRIVIEKWEIQFEPEVVDVKHQIKDGTSISVDAHCLMDADDIIIQTAAYSKVDGVFNPFVRPDPIHICKIHEHDDPLVQYMHEEILKFGNITKACPLKKGNYYYMHDFMIDESKFPMPLPEGEFRIDSNTSVVVAGVERHVVSSELYFKTVKD